VHRQDRVGFVAVVARDEARRRCREETADDELA
jgi:hypothetical protein